jgi:hypothetical protein
MKNKYIFIILFILIKIIPQGIYAQTLSQSAILSSYGEFTSNTGIRSCWTLGDFITETDGINSSVTQGFLQPELWIITNVTNIQQFDCKIFPNPFTTYFEIELPKGDSFNLKLIDISGKIIKVYKNIIDNQRFNIPNYATDMYFIIITKNNSNIKSIFKLIKLK